MTNRPVNVLHPLVWSNAKLAGKVTCDSLWKEHRKISVPKTNIQLSKIQIIIIISEILLPSALATPISPDTPDLNRCPVPMCATTTTTVALSPFRD